MRETTRDGSTLDSVEARAKERMYRGATVSRIRLLARSTVGDVLPAVRLNTP